MPYAIVKDGIIVNVIIIDDEKYIEAFNALPLKAGQGIGDTYETPEENKEKDEEEFDNKFEKFLNSFIT